MILSVSIKIISCHSFKKTRILHINYHNFIFLYNFSPYFPPLSLDKVPFCSKDSPQHFLKLLLTPFGLVGLQECITIPGSFPLFLVQVIATLFKFCA